MELELVILNGENEIMITREFEVSFPFVERANFGYETNEFTFSANEVDFAKMIEGDELGVLVGYRIEVYAHYLDDNDNQQVLLVYGGIVDSVEYDMEIFVIKTETHTHGLDIRSTWHSGSGSSANERSVFYQYNNANILKLQLGGTGIIVNPTDVLLDPDNKNQTLIQALNVWTREDTSGTRFWTIRPDGTLYGNLYLPTNLKIVPNEYLISAKYNESWEGGFNRANNFVRAYIDYDLSANAGKTPSAGLNTFADFVASRDYTCAGVAFAVSAPTSQLFSLRLYKGSTIIFELDNVSLADSDKIEIVTIAPVDIRTIMFNKIIKIENGEQYYWRGTSGSWSAGDIPDGKFGNVFNFGSRVRELGYPIGVDAMFNQADLDPIIEFEVTITHGLQYEIGDFVSLNALGYTPIEQPTSLVRREFDFRRGVARITLGVDRQTTPDKIIEAIRRGDLEL